MHFAAEQLRVRISSSPVETQHNFYNIWYFHNIFIYFHNIFATCWHILTRFHNISTHVNNILIRFHNIFLHFRDILEYSWDILQVLGRVPDMFGGVPEGSRCFSGRFLQFPIDFSEVSDVFRNQCQRRFLNC